jgi:hypothetical protein
VRRVREFEAWSSPGQVLSSECGKDLQEKIWNSGIPKDVFLGLSAIPDQTDCENLKAAFEMGELKLSDFEGFCALNALSPDVDEAESAMKFLEYSMGRPLAWIHIPEDDTDQLLSKLTDILKLFGHIVVDPEV